MDFRAWHSGLLLIENSSAQAAAKLLCKSGSAGQPQSCRPENNAT